MRLIIDHVAIGESRVEIAVGAPGREKGVSRSALDVAAAVAWVAAALVLPSDEILASWIRHRSWVARSRDARAMIE